MNADREGPEWAAAEEVYRLRIVLSWLKQEAAKGVSATPPPSVWDLLLVARDQILQAAMREPE